MPADKISIDNAKKEKLFYFVANVVVYREEDGKCLILKRSDREKVHPGKYAVPGGKLEWKDFDLLNPTRFNGEVLDFENSVEDLLKREVLEEAGIEIEKEFTYINSMAYIRPEGVPTVMLKFAAIYRKGEVQPEEGAFIGYAWVNEEEIGSYDCLLGIPEEVAATIKHFQS